MASEYEVAGIVLKPVNGSLGETYRGHVFPFTVNLDVGGSPLIVDCRIWTVGADPWHGRSEVGGPSKMLRAGFHSSGFPFQSPITTASGEPTFDTKEEAIEHILKETRDYIDSKVQGLQHWAERAQKND